MSARREHKARYNQKLIYIVLFERWLAAEPSMLRFWKWIPWACKRPRHPVLKYMRRKMWR